ncbi:MAG: FYVE zinc finger domain-containing protein [Candidatus Promineifilaceae bacterium]|nr:FYVE zinc finger domain-containing protein [Candidatus Promineifilaceae bacterium]
MEVNVRGASEGVLCYRCRRAMPVMVCHHCGRPICAECGPEPIPEGGVFERVANVEYAGLGVEKLTPDGQGVHCRFDVHAARSLNDRLLTGLGIFLAFLTPVLAFLARPFTDLLVLHTVAAFVTSVLSLYAAHLERQSWQAEAQMQRPDVPVIGRNVMIRVQERVQGEIRLDAGGRYQVFAESPEGELEFDLHFTNDDLRRWELYRRRYPLATADNSAFHAGYVFLHGAEKLQFDEEQPVFENHLALRGDVAEHGFFTGADEGDAREWRPSRSYSFPLKKEEGSAGLPVQIVPTLVSEGEWEWGIQLIVQLNPRVAAPSLSNPQVKSLELSFPPELGEPESKKPYAFLVSSAGDPPKLRWAGIPLETENGYDPEADFYVRFSESGREDVEPTQTISGRLCVVFDGALSGLEEIWRFNPLGYRIEDRPVILRRETEVVVEFSFDLSVLTLRRTVAKTEQTDEYDGVPDSGKIRKLVERFSENNVYVQRVIENPPQPNRADAKIMNRLWVIAGRRYDDVYPIDFRVVVIGKARYENEDVPKEGRTRCDVMTQGIVTEASMRDEIKRLRRELMAQIESVFS